MAVVKGVGATLAGVVVGLLLAVAIVTVLATQLFGFKVLSVQSGSMEPRLQEGSVIVTRPVQGKDVKKGDIIVYRATDEVSVVHRVLGINTIILNLTDSETGETDTNTTYQFVTKGDANDAPDALPVDQAAVEGELWFILPVSIGSLGGMQLPWVFLLTAGVLAAIWLGWELTTHRLRPANTEGPTPGPQE